jgi:hypothetical protein
MRATEQAGHEPMVVVSNSLWQRRFGSDPSLVGKPLTLDGKNYTVVGVAYRVVHKPFVN